MQRDELPRSGDADDVVRQMLGFSARARRQGRARQQRRMITVLVVAAVAAAGLAQLPQTHRWWSSQACSQ